MEYKRINNKIVFRLEMGEGLIESTQKIAVLENVKLDKGKYFIVVEGYDGDKGNYGIKVKE